jgi:hypothetical protein
MVWLSISTNGFTQGLEHEDGNEQNDFQRHRISLMISHTHIPQGIPHSNERSGIIVPSLGLNYDFWFNHKWAIGSHNDMEISTYLIENEHGAEVERERPFILSIVGIFKPSHHIELLTGIGREFENHHSYWVYRFGVEYEIDLPQHWNLSPSLTFDIKEDIYSSWTWGLVIGKRL